MENALFWIAAAALTGLSMLAVLRAFWSGGGDGSDADAAVYRAQLRELDRDAARGTLPAAEAEAARAEVARRLLAADDAGPPEARRGAAVAGATTAAATIMAVGVGTYLWLGAPGYGDLPLDGRIERLEAARAARPGQAAAEAEVPDQPVPDDADPQVVAMVERLRTVLADRPGDVEGWRLAARFEAGLLDHERAWRAQDRLVALLGEDAAADDFADLAEQMILAAGGYVSPEAERALAQAARLDPSNGRGRYYAGLMYAQGGRFDLAWRIWRRLLSDSEPGAPWLDAIRAQAERVSSLAGDPTPLDALPQPRGPSADDIEAAGALSPDERMEMIGGMVEGLSDRLAKDGGPPADWGRLVTAYGVLGRQDAAAAVYAEAKTVFAADPAALDLLSRSAEQAGLAP